MQPQESTAIATPVNDPVRQLSVFLLNRVGALMALVKLLKEHHIEVLGLSVQESTELTIARFVLSDPEGAATLFMERGIPHADCKLIVVEIHQGTHDLPHCLSALLAAEINIQFSYPLLVRPGDWPLLALNVDDPEVGAESLHCTGFKVLGQGDLSR